MKPNRASELIGLGKAAGWRIATAESLTGGWLAGALASVPGASAVFVGGAVTYATEMKTRILGVSPAVIAEHSVVSAAVAVAMAQGALPVFDADLALATTGVAGPDPLDGHPVGEVWVAAALRDGSVVCEQCWFDGSRDDIRAAAVAAALRLGRRHVLGALGSAPKSG